MFDDCRYDGRLPDERTEEIMPHLIVEYSANLEPALDIATLVEALHEAALETGVFPIGGMRTRAARRDLYRIADGHADNAFIHVQARIGAGGRRGAPARPSTFSPG